MSKVGSTVKPFDQVLIIFNPKSTSQRAEKIAKRLERRLKRQKVGPIELKGTRRSGHATTLAQAAANSHQQPLIISVSGDGGYNEVINGVMTAVDESKAGMPMTAVEAAGNANDHYNVIREKSLVLAIKKRQVKAIDLLLLEATCKDFSLKRYAHSYIGFGVTPYVARSLNSQELNRWQELQMLAKLVAKFPPFTVKFQDGRVEKLDSLIFSNIRRMAKVLQVAKQTKPDDGSFEVITHEHQPRHEFLLTTLKVAIRGRRSSQQATQFSFTLPEAQDVQFDGEVMKLPANCRVKITCRPQILRTF